MFKEIFIIFLVSLFVVNAEDLSPYTSVVIAVNIDSEINLDYGSSSKLDYFEAKLNFFPKENIYHRIKNIEFTSEPSASVSEAEEIKYRWTSENSNLKYGLNAEVEVKNVFRNVGKSVKFPFNDFDEDLLEYIQEREFTDINRDIRDQANEIIAGEDDLFDVVYKIAEWTRKYVEYDLNTLTEKSVQKSSWVFKEKYGVCDEITNLFISFLRSLKIPVKYVSGIAYSDTVEGWSPHAWSEVYFPEYGWIPFDVTFGQYGWLDAGHIKMAEGFDAHEPSVEYFWRAVNVGINSKNFEVSAELKEKGEKFNPLIELDLKLLENNVGEGSYVPIEVSVENLQPFYVGSLIYISSAPGVVDDNSQALLLKPFQKKKLYWTINLTQELQSGFMYTGEVTVEDSFGAKSSKELSFAKGLDVFTYENSESLMGSLMQEEGSVKTYDLKLTCDAERNAYFKDENLNAVCFIENRGNVPLKFNLCLKEDCKDVNLMITEEKNVAFSYDLSKYNKERLFVRALSNEFTISDYLIFDLYDEPQFNIESITADEISYNEKGEIKINVNAVPGLSVLDIEILDIGKFSFEEVNGNRELIIPFNGYELNEGNNFITTKFSYEFKNEIFEVEKGFSLNVKKIGFFEKLIFDLRLLIGLSKVE
jgi:transglutaminase-like putative cysteine protease